MQPKKHRGCLKCHQQIENGHCRCQDHRRAQLKDTIATCRVIDESQIDTSKVQMLNKVTIKNTKTGATMTYTLVSETEANFKEGKLSIHTPIAQALVGKKLGDKVMVKVPPVKWSSKLWISVCKMRFVWLQFFLKS